MLENLLKLATYLEDNVRDDQFDMDVVQDWPFAPVGLYQKPISYGETLPGGFCACALGWGYTIFPEFVFETKPTYDVGDWQKTAKAAEVLGLTEKEVDDLTNNCYLSRTQMVAKLREIYNKKREIADYASNT